MYILGEVIVLFTKQWLRELLALHFHCCSGNNNSSSIRSQTELMDINMRTRWRDGWMSDKGILCCYFNRKTLWSAKKVNDVILIARRVQTEEEEKKQITAIKKYRTFHPYQIHFEELERGFNVTRRCHRRTGLLGTLGAFGNWQIIIKNKTFVIGFGDFPFRESEIRHFPSLILLSPWNFFFHPPSDQMSLGTEDCEPQFVMLSFEGNKIIIEIIGMECSFKNEIHSCFSMSFQFIVHKMYLRDWNKKNRKYLSCEGDRNAAAAADVFSFAKSFVSLRIVSE